MLVTLGSVLLSTVTVLRWGLSGATARTTTSDSAGVLARPLPRVNGRLSAAQIADEREARTLMIEFEVKRTWGVLSLWRARRGRRAATTAISPLMNKTRQRFDGLPDSVWREPYIVGFLGMLISKEHGGLGFSAQAQSLVLGKISSRSPDGVTIVMVPNSLGPGELIEKYGTEMQKAYYLPRLARGEEIPCFALTGPFSGSDAASMRDGGKPCR